MLRVNGATLPSPTVYKVDISDLDGEAERNARGDLMRDRIAIKRKIELEWGILTNVEISTILKSVKDSFFTVEYPDPVEGKNQTKTFYVGDRSAPMLLMKGNTPHWQGLTMNLIER